MNTLAIGTIITYKNKKYQIVESYQNAPICDGCDLFDECMNKHNQVDISNISTCGEDRRTDGNNIVFKEIKNAIVKEISIPTGYEIDIEKSDLSNGVIVFKSKYKTLDEIYSKCNEHDDFIHKSSNIQKLFAIMNYYNDGWKPKEFFGYYFEYDTKHKSYAIRNVIPGTNQLIQFKRKSDIEEILDNPNFRPIIDELFIK